MRNYTIPEYPKYDEEIRMLENTDPADADSVFNPLFYKMINNTAAIRSKFNGITMKDKEIVNISNTRDYDYLSLELCGNTRVTPANPELPISPDNVAVIESAGENGIIHLSITKTKNLLPNRAVTQTYDGVTAMVNADKSITLISTPQTGAVWNDVWVDIYRSQGIRFPADTNIQIKGLDFYTLASVTDIDGKQIYWPIHEGKPYLVKKGSAISRITLFVKENFTSNTTIYPMIWLNGEDNAYAPYDGCIHSIPLKSTDGNTLEPLRSIKNDKGNVVAQDKIIKKDGNWMIERNVKSQRLSGTEQLGVGENKVNTIVFVASGTVQPYKENYISFVNCSRFKTSNNDWRGDYEQCITSGNVNGLNTRIYINKSRLTTPDIAGIKAWLTEHPVTIEYALVNPTYQPLHPDTQAILNSLEKTYNGTTVIMGTDEIPPLITSTYARGSMSTLNAKQISGCEVNDEIIGDRNLLTAGKTVKLINSMITERLEATK